LGDAGALEALDIFIFPAKKLHKKLTEIYHPIRVCHPFIAVTHFNLLKHKNQGHSRKKAFMSF
jgi:hypothetical protein